MVPIVMTQAARRATLSADNFVAKRHLVVISSTRFRKLLGRSPMDAFAASNFARKNPRLEGDRYTSD